MPERRYAKSACRSRLFGMLWHGRWSGSDRTDTWGEETRKSGNQGIRKWGRFATGNQEIEKVVNFPVSQLPSFHPLVSGFPSPERRWAVETDVQAKTRRKVTLAKEVGFCFGVKRAINLTRQALAERNNVFILGDLVHNKRVTDELEAKGLQKVEEYTPEKSGTMVIRAHGLPKTKIQEAKDRGLDVVDATCPIVLRAQEAAQTLEARGCQ